jgi:hypothetical protein
MATMAELPATLEALAAYLNVPVKSVVVRPHHFDSRIDWNTHIVTVEGHAVGFTDGPICSKS